MREPATLTAEKDFPPKERIVPSAGHQIVVMLSDADEAICHEMSERTFAELRARKTALTDLAASVQRACYCVVGAGLKLRGIVYFLLPLDERGKLQSEFNLPLEYLAQHAGLGGDLGDGGIRVASRGRCAVPWHSLNLWEPQDEAFLSVVQQRIYRNRLKLKAVIEGGLEFPDDDEDVVPDVTETLVGDAIPSPDMDAARSGQPHAENAFAERLDEVFGASGKLSMPDLIRLHSQQLEDARAKFREDIETQQSVYLGQIREYQSQIQELKVALRQEQTRNRRLAEMLRGDP